MSKKISFLISLGLCLVLVMAGYAKKPEGKGGGRTNIPSATFRDCTDGFSGVEDPTNPGQDFDCPTVNHNDRIKSDGVGAYVGGVDVQAKLDKHVFYLSLQPQSGGMPDRAFSLDFAECTGVGCDGPFNLPGEIIEGGILTARPRGDDKSLNLVKMKEDPNTSFPVNFRMSFPVLIDRVEIPWYVRFAPTDPGCEGSNTASVTRTGENTWVFEASPSDKACLLSQNEESFYSPLNFRGLFYMPFQLVVERK